VNIVLLDIVNDIIKRIILTCFVHCVNDVLHTGFGPSRSVGVAFSGVLSQELDEYLSGKYLQKCHCGIFEVCI